MRAQWIAIVLGLFVLVSPPSVGAEMNEVRLATQRNVNDPSEVDVATVACAMNRIEVPFSITQVPWERAQRNTERGHFDGFFMATKRSDRDLYAVQSVPFATIQWLYVTRKGSGVSPEDPNFGTRVFSSNMGSSRLKWLAKKHEKGEITKKNTSRNIWTADENGPWKPDRCRPDERP